jgi:hypothetical protein
MREKRGDRGPQVELAAQIEDDAADYLLGNRFADLSVTLVGNLVLGRKCILGGLKAHL